MAAIEKYRKSWDKIESEERAARERLRKRALKVSMNLKNLLIREFKVKRIVLFGSVLRPGDFGEDSDIDIAVEGLPKHRYFEAAARVMMESPFNVDLKPAEDVSELLRKKIAAGKVLYEKRADS